MMSETGEHSNLHRVLLRIMMVMVTISFTLCLIIFVFLLRSTTLLEATKYTVVLLVASIPHAIEIVTTLTLLIGSRELMFHGACVTRLSAIEGLAKMSILCSDKTGTLTLNKMKIQSVHLFCKTETQQSVIRYAAMATKWKAPQVDALDELVVHSVPLKSLQRYEQLQHHPYDPHKKRSEGMIRDRETKDTYLTTKGQAIAVANLCYVEGDPVLIDIANSIHTYGLRGIRCLGVAKTVEGDMEKWIFLGLLVFMDPIRIDSRHCVQEARNYGVAVKMITGDHEFVAIETAMELDIGDHIVLGDRLPLLIPISQEKPYDLVANYGDMCLHSDVFAQVIPEHKYLIVECLREMNYVVGMIGDGVNDAPALKRADVGIAVKNATDASRASADIVLTHDGLTPITYGIQLCRCVVERIKVFIIYRLAATLQLLFFQFISVLAFQPRQFQPSSITKPSENWPSYFEFPVLLILLITLVNDGKDCLYF